MASKPVMCATAAAAAMCLLADEEDLVVNESLKRRHRFWTRSWTQEREEKEKNTIYKLQQELLEVGQHDVTTIIMSHLSTVES